MRKQCFPMSNGLSFALGALSNLAFYHGAPRKIGAMTFLEMLRTAAAQNQSMLCVGLDPEPSRFPCIVNASAALLIALTPQIGPQAGGLGRPSS